MKRLPCRTECRSRQAEDYLNRLRGPKREGAEEETRRRLRRRRGPATRVDIYMSCLWRASGRNQEHPSSCPQTKRTGCHWFSSAVDWNSRGASRQELTASSAIRSERQKEGEREKEKRGLISCTERNWGPLLFGYIVSLCISWVVEITARSNLTFVFGFILPFTAT